MNNNFFEKAKEYVGFFCNVKPNRRTGSKGNKEAIKFFKEQINPWNYEIDTTEFSCLDYENNGSTLSENNTTHEVFTSPFSVPGHIESTLIIASNLHELETLNYNNKLLLLKGEICKEQLMPKKFIFYNPKHHKEIYSLLEQKKPAAIITATTKNEEVVGNFYPFPLFEDGDFDIPSVYCQDIVGNTLEQIKKKKDPVFTLTIDAQRISSTASNVIAKKYSDANQKIVICAHIDARDTTPGASDNASGTAVLLLLAEMLHQYKGTFDIEIVAFNGEDYYSVGGQMDYLKRYGNELNDIYLVINIDDVGYKQGATCISYYNCSEDMEGKTSNLLKHYKTIQKGMQWFQGDHMIFAQKEIATIAFTSEKSMELLKTITHTKHDTPDILNYAKIVELASFLKDLIDTL